MKIFAIIYEDVILMKMFSIIDEDLSWIAHYISGIVRWLPSPLSTKQHDTYTTNRCKHTRPDSTHQTRIIHDMTWRSIQTRLITMHRTLRGGGGEEFEKTQIQRRVEIKDDLNDHAFLDCQLLKTTLPHDQTSCVRNYQIEGGFHDVKIYSSLIEV